MKIVATIPRSNTVTVVLCKVFALSYTSNIYVYISATCAKTTINQSNSPISKVNFLCFNS